METFIFGTFPEAEEGRNNSYFPKISGKGVNIDLENYRKSTTYRNTYVEAIAILAPSNWFGLAGVMLAGIFSGYKRRQPEFEFPAIEFFVFDEKELCDQAFKSDSPNKPGWGYDGKQLPKLMKQIDVVASFYRHRKSLHCALFVPTPYAGIIIPHLPVPQDVPLSEMMQKSGRIYTWNRSNISEEMLQRWATTLNEVAYYGRS